MAETMRVSAIELPTAAKPLDWELGNDFSSKLEPGQKILHAKEKGGTRQGTAYEVEPVLPNEVKQGFLQLGN